MHARIFSLAIRPFVANFGVLFAKPRIMSPFSTEILAEGKTKVICRAPGDPQMVVVHSKDDITAGDGAKHDLMSGKATMSTQTTCNVFRLLKECGIPVGFGEQLSATSFSAPNCRMLPFEVVTRRQAHGSYLKRHPELSKGHLFPQLKVEFYLKTNKRRWNDHDLACDDPLMECGEGVVRLFHPGQPIVQQTPFLVLRDEEVFGLPEERLQLQQMSVIARRAFLVLEKAWQVQGGTLVDCKVEFGSGADGQLLLADVIDNDSWRVLEKGSYLDKQVYRDGGQLDAVAANYQRVVEITGRFKAPAPQELADIFAKEQV